MFTVDIELSNDIENLRVPDGAGGEIAVSLKRGLNTVPLAVAEHWYVKKFIVPRALAPRVALPVEAWMLPAQSEQPSAPEATVEAAPDAPAADPEPSKSDQKVKAKA